MDKRHSGVNSIKKLCASVLQVGPLILLFHTNLKLIPGRKPGCDKVAGPHNRPGRAAPRGSGGIYSYCSRYATKAVGPIGWLRPCNKSLQVPVTSFQVVFTTVFC